MKRWICAVVSLALLSSLSGCRAGPLSDPGVRDRSGLPGRMVCRLEIDLHPAEESLHRIYTDSGQIASVVGILRGMPTGEEPETPPDLNGGQSYFSITAVYPNGDSRVYHLLGHRYLQRGDEPWQEVDPDKVMDLIDFLKAFPTDPKTAL